MEILEISFERDLVSCASEYYFPEENRFYINDLTQRSQKFISCSTFEY